MAATPKDNGTSLDGQPPCHHHIKFTWPSLAAVTYRRHTEHGPSVTVDGETLHRAQLLKTATLARHHHRVYRRCWMYEFGGCCPDGERCGYVHVVAVDKRLRAPRRERHRHKDVTTPKSPAEDFLCAASRSGAVDELDAAEPVVSASPPPRGTWWFRNPYAALTGDVIVHGAFSHTPS